MKMGLGIGAGMTAFDMVGKGLSSAIGLMEGAVNSASDLRESMSLTGQVFEGNADQVSKWADGAAAAFGQSKREALDFASNFGTAFKNVGLSLDETTDKAQEMTRLAADLGSAFNASSEEAATALRSGLLGESEPLRRFGVFLDEAKTKAKALAMGMKIVGGKMTDAQKVTARYALILEQTADSQGMFGRDTESLADAQKAFAAEMENLSAEAGQVLLPVLKDIVTWARVDGIPAIKAVGDAIDDVFNANEPGRRSADDWSWPFGPKDTPVVDVGPFKDVLGGYSEGKDAAEAMAAAAVETAYVYDQRGQRIKSTAKGVAGAVTTVGEASTRAADLVKSSTEKIVDYYDDLRSELTGLGSDAADAIYDPIIAASDYAATKREMAEQRAIAAAKGYTQAEINEAAKSARTKAERLAVSKMHTKAEVRDAKNALTELQKTAFEQQVALIGYGKLNAKEQTKFLADLKTKWASATGEAKKDIAALIAYITKLDANVNIKVSSNSWGNFGARATGGPVSAGELYRVNEPWVGTEYFRPNVDGAVLTPLQAAQSGGGSSGPQITIYNPEPRAAEADIGRVLRRTAAMGMR